MNSRKLTVVGYVALCLGLGACSGSAYILDRIDGLVQRENYYQAYWAAAEAVEDYPSDAEVQRVFRERRIDYLNESGVEMLFADQEQGAIVEFRRVLQIDADNPMAKYGIRKARGKLARNAARQADVLLYSGKYVKARKLYQAAFEYVPGYADAAKGIAIVDNLERKRTEGADEHYKLANRAKGDRAYKQTHYHSDLAAILDPKMQKALRLRAKAARVLADSRLERGVQMEEKGAYAAALSEYRAVKAVHPDTLELDTRIARVAREVKARELRRQAEMLVRKKDFDGADKALDEAFTLSESEKAHISGLMLTAKRRRFDDAYVTAKDFELEYRFEDAIVAYETLMAKDEIVQAWTGERVEELRSRIKTLVNAVRIATESWEAGQEAEAKKDLKAAIEAYSEAVFVYPAFKGLDKRIEQLRARQ